MKKCKQLFSRIGNKRLPRKCMLRLLVVLSIISIVPLLYYFSEPPIHHTIINIENIEKPRRFVIFDLGKYHFDVEDNFVVDNCFVTTNESLWNLADVVAVSLRKVQKRDSDKFFKLRRKKQIWVMVFDESAFNYWTEVRQQHLQNAFNWSMTHERRSDVYIPYGHTYKLAEPRDIPDFVLKKRRAVAAIVSNCQARNGRLDVIRALDTTIAVDLYGKCGKGECEGYLSKLETVKDPCPDLKHYMFYLAFENSNCHDYITEKPFLHGLSLGPVPVVMGARKDDYQKLLPPGSFIYAGDFDDTIALGNYLIYLIENKEKYKEYHIWRKVYEVTYRMQYFNSWPTVWKPLCDKLNDNSLDSLSKTLKDPQSWLDINYKCTERVQINIRNQQNGLRRILNF